MLVLLFWKAFSAYTRNEMHAGPVSYRTFRLAFMSDTPILWSTLRFLHDIIRNGSGGSRATMVFLAAAMSFTLAFPIIASAMTGYRADMVAFVMDENQKLVPSYQFTTVAYVVHDGSRVLDADEFAVPFDEKLPCKYKE